MKKNISTLVLSGGGIKGLCYIGVLKKLEEIKEKKNKKNKLIDININTICGVSAGCIFGLLYILGYTSTELTEIFLSLNFKNLKKIKIMNLVSTYGLDTGEKIMEFLSDLMEKKNFNKEMTLLELFNKTKIDFQIMVTNLNSYSYEKFNYITKPNLKVLDAIRMTISLPFIFSINKLEENIYIDGGIIENYPIKLFEDNLENVLGIRIVNHGELSDHIIEKKIDSIEEYILNVFSCFMIKKQINTISEQFMNHTIYIHTEDVNDIINYNIGKYIKKKLINIGYKSTSNFFKN